MHSSNRATILLHLLLPVPCQDDEGTDWLCGMGPGLDVYGITVVVKALTVEREHPAFRRVLHQH